MHLNSLKYLYRDSPALTASSLLASPALLRANNCTDADLLQKYFKLATKIFRYQCVAKDYYYADTLL